MVNHRVRHPAPYNPHFLARAQDWVDPSWLVLDPFAGIGNVHTLKARTIGIEIEKEWASQHPNTLVGDATHMPFKDHIFDAVVVSPCFGNRMSDHHNAKDGSTRITYKHVLGHDLQANNAGAMPWGKKYRQLHRDAWTETDRVLKPTGRFILNSKNHLIKGVEQPVSEFHLSTLFSLGWILRAAENIKAPGMRWGANRQRVDHEWLFVLEKAH